MRPAYLLIVAALIAAAAVGGYCDGTLGLFI
jgi:hypothetical protein